MSLAAFLILSVHAQDAARHQVKIEPQPLGAALKALAAQTGLQVLIFSQDAANKRSPSVSGNLTNDEALAQLLDGSGLTYERIDDHTVAVRKKMERDVPAAPPGATTNVPQPLDERTQQSSTAQLEEVVVTAQKRAERLVDVPQSVSVLSSDYLTRLGATQFTDFADTVPGLSFATAGAGFTQISLRGVTIGNDVSPTVGIYVDEIPYGSTTAFALNAQFRFDSALFDLDRIEVLHGPQGTLYGASAMGGIIKYVTKQPNTTDFGGDARVGVSDTHDGGVNYDTAAAVNIPIVSGKAAVRVSGFESHDGGYIDNLAQNRSNVNRADTYGGRLDFLLTPVDQLKVRITGFIQDISRDGEATADYSFAGAQPYGNLGQYRLYAEPFYQQFRLVSGAVTYDFGPMTLTSVSGYQTSHTNYIGDVSAVYAPLLNSFGFGPYSAVGYQNPLGTDKVTQEIRLASSPTSRPLEWLIGGFYTRETSTNYQQFLLHDLGGLPAPNTLYTVSRPSTYKEYAAFGDLTWHLSSSLDVTGGIRWSQNRQEFEQIGSGALIGSYPSTHSGENVATYLGDLRYHFNDQATGYLRYATGYRPGGPNVVTIAGGQRTFAADHLRSYEVGLKAETSDRRFGIDLAAYNIDWSNIQLLVIRSGFGVYVNAPGNATVQGAELSLTARPVSDLRITSALAYQHAYIDQADDDVGASKGERLPGVPRFTGSLDADYTFSDVALRPSIGAALRHVSDEFSGFANAVKNPNVAPQYHLPAYTTFDLRTGIVLKAVDLQLYVHNLFDDRGQLGILLPQFGARVGVIQPRTIGMMATTRF